jgi:hypothetical protein
MIGGSIISKGALGEASIIISFSRPSLTYLFSRPICAAKNTSGVTWEQIRRRDGQAFLVRPAARSGSPLDVPGIDAGLSRKEILDLVRESRRSTGRLLYKSRAPHQSPHRGKGSPSRQGSALNPT